MEKLLKSLVAIEEACAEAFNKNAVNRILEYFDTDISGFSSTTHDRFQGKDELRKTFEYYLAEADNSTYEIMEPEIMQFGDIAVLSFYWKVKLERGGKVKEVPGRGTHVYRRSGDEWKIVHEHFSRSH
ncbi:MAG: nuclear transport factor 2 family protein [Calditrichia bacterium]